MVEEFINVISRRKFVSKYGIFPISTKLLTKKLVESQIKIPIPHSSIKIRDPKDIIVLSTAIEGHANYLVTGDQDLLVLAHHKSIEPLKIVTPAEFIHIIE